MNEQTKKAILVVDDDPKSLKLLAAILTQEGYRVITAQSGKHALETIELKKPSLVLLDIMMPEMDGMETLKRIKAFDPDIPVAMVTGVWDEDEAKRAFQAGAYEYITKPIDDSVDLVLFFESFQNMNIVTSIFTMADFCANC